MADQEPDLELQPEERPILNADADFIRCAPVDVRNAFEGMPAKVFLREGETFFRFLEKDFNGTAEGFWLPAATYHRLRNENLLQGVSIPDWAVTQSTLLPRRPQPAMFCQATLVERVYGFRGLLKVSGGLPQLQFWIPGLAGSQLFVRCYNL
ncbi:hypothetical protein [uncultured Paludibaculum sp.]|uniref:hypothetical protein n=1 Tax=uncultured Paludibaculum sp. TaxID=1765020 RepID=UPI002AAA7268|nr:hypothetical protein [uncultured Paludibaculum sp.]